MQIQPGATQPDRRQEGCGNVCHTASADGSTLVANVGSRLVERELRPQEQRVASSTSQPDLDVHLRRPLPGRQLPHVGDQLPHVDRRASRLYNTQTGARSPRPAGTASSSTAALGVLARRQAHRVQPRGHGRRAHARASMSFDIRTHTFSGLDRHRDRPDTTPSPGRRSRPTRSGSSTTRGRTRAFETDNGATGDVYMVDLATQTVHAPRRRSTATRAAASATYLPAQDPGLSFAPTVLPEAVGGYFWVVFTSHRSYGNTLAVARQRRRERQALGRGDGHRPDGRPGPEPPRVLPRRAGAQRRQPAWLLGARPVPGRTAARAPRATSAAAGSAAAGRTEAACAGRRLRRPGGDCSQDYEKCSTASDCCNTQDSCINNICAEPAPK